MNETSEVIDRPLTVEELGEKYRKMCDDPYFANVPGKLELDTWGRIIMSPASTYHGTIQGRLVRRLAPLGGEALVEVGIATAAGAFVPDVAWASSDYYARHGKETPLTRAPELCIEVASPSNSLQELNEKVASYIATGAVEAWIVFPQSKRIEIYGKAGRLDHAAFALDLSGLF
jgi:Uma2 family endonuclease